MSANRILLLVAVFIAVLFAVSLALGKRNRDHPVDPRTSSFNKWVRMKKFDLAEVSVRGGRWQTGQWIIDTNVLAATLDIAPSKDNRKLRRVSLGLSGSDAFEVRFTPQADTNQPGKFADPDASPLRITRFEAGKPPVDLTILSHGGRLDVQRLRNTRQALFKLE